MSMWRPFDQEARTSIVRAHEAARESGKQFIDPWHLLLGISSSAGGTSRVLDEFGATREVLSKAARVMFRKRQEAQEMAFTPETRRVIEFACDEAREFGQGFIGSPHLALAMLRDENDATRLLGRVGVPLQSLRERLIEIAKTAGPPPPRRPEAAHPDS